MSISLSEVPFEQAVFFKFFPFKAFGELAIPQGRPWILEPGVICGHLVTLAWKYAIFKILSCEVSSWQVKSGDTVTKEGDGRQGDRWGNLFSKPALCPVCKITAPKQKEIHSEAILVFLSGENQSQEGRVSLAQTQAFWDKPTLHCKIGSGTFRMSPTYCFDM